MMILCFGLSNRNRNSKKGKHMYKIIVDHAPSQEDNEIIREGLYASQKHIVGEPDQYFSIFLKDENGKVCGGIQASVDTQSVYINLLWIAEKLRNQGYGKKLLDAAEQEAFNHGCIYS